MDTKMGQIQEKTLYSEELLEEMTILIYLPASYSPLYKYALCIVNDGKDYYQMGKLGRAADSLLQENRIENVIFAGIHYKDVHDRRKKYHPEGEQQQKYIRFLAHELVPFLDDAFPSYGISGGRAIMGDSLAATVSLMAALQYPNTFGRVIMHSPYVDSTVMEAVESFRSAASLQLYQVIGTEETDVPTTDKRRLDFLKPNRRLAEMLQSKGFPHFYEEFEGGHTWKYWQADLPRALKAMFGQ